MKIPLLLFAKAPIAGKVKTRLQTHCSAQQAAQIAQILLEESILKVTRHWPGPVLLSVALDQKHPFLQRMLNTYPIKLTSQCEGDLGDKMQGAFDEFGYPAAIMGCDAPHVCADELTAAYDCLAQGRPVLGPSDDGGYYFIGLQNQAAALFAGVSWGTDLVLQETLDRAAISKINFQLLKSLNDVDEWPDALSAAKALPRLQSYIDEIKELQQ